MKDNKKVQNKVVFGIYRHETSVERAVSLLRDRGFRGEDISALLPTGASNKEFAHKNATKTPEGAATGAASGAVLGGALGWLVGIGSLAIPGVGPFIAAGPIVAALAGAGLGGTVGGLAGALIGMGIPEYEAKLYEGQIREGGILLAVHCDDSDWVDLAKQVLKDTGAMEISSSEEASADFAKSGRPQPATRL